MLTPRSAHAHEGRRTHLDSTLIQNPEEAECEHFCRLYGHLFAERAGTLAALMTPAVSWSRDVAGKAVGMRQI